MKPPQQNSTALRLSKDLLWAIALCGLVVGTGRFIFGLGAATNMSDALPWGWWKIFNMVAGAALATSGFVVAAIIYIFQWKKYESVARLSVVIGFLGYGSSLFSLLFDIGLPHRGWHPFFMWNPHSFLFEVFWCVSVYWAITALELVPIVTERLPFPRLTHWIHQKILPVVVLGITLSTMHHSSLGSLFMVSPTRLYPLWHSYWIPPEYFISAMGAGLSTILLLMVVISSIYGWTTKQRVLDGLATGAASMLGLYLVVKIVDFSVHDKWNFVVGPDITWETYIFWAEISLQAIIPVLILGLPALRRRMPLLIFGTFCAFIGLIMHRIDTGIVGYFRSSEAVYMPNLAELLLSAGILSAATLAFFFLVERFHVLDAPEEHHDEDGEVPDEPPPGVTWWTRSELREVLMGSGARRAVVIFVVVTPLTWLAFQGSATGAFKPVPRPVQDGVQELDQEQQRYRIDGDRNGQFTDYGHKQHVAALQKMFKIDEQATCIKCHHLGLPMEPARRQALPAEEQDKPTGCFKCHRDMENATPLFDAERHAARFKTEADREAFLGKNLDDRRQNFEACMACHEERAPMPGLAGYKLQGFDMRAPGFKDAMHGNCLTCHRLMEREAKHDPASASSTGNCLFCHRQWADEGMEFAKELLKKKPEPTPAEDEDGVEAEEGEASGGERDEDGDDKDDDAKNDDAE